MRTAFHGLLIGLSIAAPVGPVGLLCIRRTLAEGRASGFVSGLGASTAHAVYAGIAAFGLTFLSGALMSQRGWTRLLGGAFLVYLGVKTVLARPEDPVSANRGKNLTAAYGSMFLLAMTNPMTVLYIGALFAGLGVGASRADNLTASWFVLGVFSGSTLWWFLLCGGVGAFRRRFSPGWIRWINRISGLLIAGFGLLTMRG